jgi:hypothetical protein
MNADSTVIAQSPLNVKLLRYIKRTRPNAPVFALWNSVLDPYNDCGCHPDIVTVLWDRIGKSLPTDCRGLVYGTPVLAHSKSGVILAIGLGTACGLLLPGALATLAMEAGAKTVQRWSTGDEMDIQKEFGEGWFFDGEIQLPNEICLCKEVYKIFDYIP